LNGTIFSRDESIKGKFAKVSNILAIQITDFSEYKNFLRNEIGINVESSIPNNAKVIIMHYTTEQDDYLGPASSKQLLATLYQLFELEECLKLEKINYIVGVTNESMA